MCHRASARCVVSVFKYNWLDIIDTWPTHISQNTLPSCE